MQAATCQAQTGINCKKNQQIFAKIGQESVLEAFWSGMLAVSELQENHQLRSRLALGASWVALKARRGLEPFPNRFGRSCKCALLQNVICKGCP